MPVSAKQSLYMHVKTQFTNMRAKLGDPCNWIEVLPSSPFEMQRDFPEQYAFAFAGGAILPGLSHIDVQAVANLDMSYGCRGGKPLASSTQPANRTDGSSGFERLASVLMESMNSNNTRLMELVLTGKGNPQTQPRALAILEGRPHHDSLGSESSYGSSSLQGAAPVMPALANSPAWTDSQRDSSPDASAKDFVRAASIADMLDALDARKVEKACIKKAAAAEAKAKSKAATAAPVAKKDAAIVPVAVKAATVAKAVTPLKKAKTESTAVVPAEKNVAGVVPAAKKAAAVQGAKDVPSRTNAKTEAAAIVPVAKKAAAVQVAKDVPSLKKAKTDAAAIVPAAKKAAAAVPAATDGGAAPRPKPSIIPSTKYDSKGDLILGCSKCRFSFAGCSQCRYVGFCGGRWNAHLST